MRVEHMSGSVTKAPAAKGALNKGTFAEDLLNRDTKKPLYDNFRYEVREVGPSVTEVGSKEEGSRNVRNPLRPRRRRRVALVERFAGTERVVGCAEGWRASALQEIDRHFAERDGRERGFRLFLALKSMRTVDARRGPRLFEALKRMTLEETIFWVWQYHSYGERAIGAMKHIHLGGRLAPACRWD